VAGTSALKTRFALSPGHDDGVRCARIARQMLEMRESLTPWRPSASCLARSPVRFRVPAGASSRDIGPGQQQQNDERGLDDHACTVSGHDVPPVGAHVTVRIAPSLVCEIGHALREKVQNGFLANKTSMAGFGPAMDVLLFRCLRAGEPQPLPNRSGDPIHLRQIWIEGFVAIGAVAANLRPIPVIILVSHRTLPAASSRTNTGTHIEDARSLKKFFQQSCDTSIVAIE
jgi:hypothetical protein